MPYIPEGADWYLAEIIKVVTAQGEPDVSAEICSILIRAASPDEAYRKAMEKGSSFERTYTTPPGIEVTQRFGGLRDLNVIYEPLEDGCEIISQEISPVSPERLSELACPREKLGVFLPTPTMTVEEIFQQRANVDLQ